MPTYDYLCDGCGHEFELFQAITGRVRRKCPECGEPKLKRLIGTDLQGKRLLPDRLSKRLVQEVRRGREEVGCGQDLQEEGQGREGGVQVTRLDQEKEEGRLTLGPDRHRNIEAPASATQLLMATTRQTRPTSQPAIPNAARQKTVRAVSGRIAVTTVEPLKGCIAEHE
jgi:putative FmdB family regulatory protein